ncbi:Alanine--glyoxylate aminotransferase 2 homolog 3, mitochondrial [Linum perenne]
MPFHGQLFRATLQTTKRGFTPGRYFSAFPSTSAATVDAPPQLPPFDHQPRPYKGPSADEVLQKRKTFLGPSLFYYYQKPLNIVEGKMQYLFDEHGRRYLDAFAGIVTVSAGHCHPEILKAIVDQSELLQHATTIYLHHAIADFAEGLAEKMPGNLKGEIHHVMNPDPYRAFGTSGRVAGFISETIQGVGGAVELAPGYLKLVYDTVRKAGGVCIADEVQTGFGRTGSHYWGFETQGVIPDIVTMAKVIKSKPFFSFVLLSALAS